MKLTDLQAQLLRDARDHNDPMRFVFGYQTRGGATMSLMRLARRGLLEGNAITDVGREVLDAHEARTEMSKPQYAQSMLIALCEDLQSPRDDREMLIRHLLRHAKVGVSREGDKVTLTFDADMVEALVRARNPHTEE